MRTRKRHDDHGDRHRSSTELGTTSRLGAACEQAAQAARQALAARERRDGARQQLALAQDALAATARC